MTLAEIYNPAIRIIDPFEASIYFAALVDVRLAHSPLLSREQAEQIERNNIGYWAGYYDNETRLRVERLYGATHPIFGKSE